MSSLLQQIGLKYGTDKSRNIEKGISYLEKYEKYIYKRTGEKLNVLEMGVLNGASVNTWHDYFLFSNIIGIDIDPRCKKYEHDRIEIFIGSQDSQYICDKIKSKYKTLDLIIDDGAHLNELMIKSFDMYWPLLADNGVYIMEDVPMCWGDLTPHTKNWPGMQYNDPNLELDNSKVDINKFLIDKIKDCQRQNATATTDIYSIDFSCGSFIFTKKI